MRISAEICFVVPCDPDGAVIALRERGYQIDKIEDLRDDSEVGALFIHAARDVADAELAGTPGDHWAASGLVLDESSTIVTPFGGYSDNAGSTSLPDYPYDNPPPPEFEELPPDNDNDEATL